MPHVTWSVPNPERLGGVTLMLGQVPEVVALLMGDDHSPVRG
jgi:hypothetical protein